MIKYKKGYLVKLEKLSPTINPDVPTSDGINFKAGENNGRISLPVGYTLEGILIHDVKEGHELSLHRLKRNEVSAFGITTTSLIVQISDNLLFTHNSVYRITVLSHELQEA